MTKLSQRQRLLAALLTATFVAGCGSESPSKITSGEPLQLAPVFSSENGALHLRVTAETARSSIAGKEYDRMFIYRTELVGGTGRKTEGTTSS